MACRGEAITDHEFEEYASRGIELKSMHSRRSDMAHYAGLDVSVRHTSICIVDDSGKIVRETRVLSDPAAIIPILTAAPIECRRVGFEAGPLSQWLFDGLAAADLPAICVETRHMKAALAAQVNKTDRNDARGIAQMMRVGLYRPVHVKSIASQEKRTLLVARKLLQGQNRAIENDIRGLLRTFGLKVGPTSAGAFDIRVRELVEDRPRLAAIVHPLLAARMALGSQFATLHRMLLDLVRYDPVCRRFMTVPGVGAVVAITFQATVDIPQRFANSKSVGAHFGLTPRAFSSGETDYTGRVSRCGDALMRAMLHEAAHTLLTHTQRWSRLKAWGIRVAQRRGLQKATVAVARKLAVILHRMWLDKTEFCWGAQVAAA
jgi:transposase